MPVGAEPMSDFMVGLWIVLVALCMLLSNPCEAETRTLYKAPDPQYVMKCQRWSALLTTASTLGMPRLLAYIKANPERFNKTDAIFLNSEIAQLSTLKKFSYAEAMYICGEARRA